MTKKFIFQLSAVCLTAMFFIFTGCQDKDYFDPDVKPNDGKEASTANFSTTRSVELQVNYDVTNGYVSTYDVYIENPLNEDGTLKAGLTPITGGINVAGINQKRVLPAFASDLYLYSTDLFIPKLMYAKVENGVASFEPFAYGKEVSQPETRAIGSNGHGIDSYLTTIEDYYLQTTGNGAKKTYKYDLKSPVKTHAFPAEVKAAISQAFPDDDDLKKLGMKSPDLSYFKDAVIKIKSDEKGTGANIYVSLAIADGRDRSSLSYVVYTNKNKDIESLTPAERANLKIVNIFQLADMYNNPWKHSYNSDFKNQGLTAGKAVKLKYVDNDGNFGETFPEGAQIAFILHSDAFNDSRNKFEVKDNSKRIYSIAAWNTNNAKQTVFFGAKDNNKNPYSFFGFEDLMGEEIKDCNDVMFRVETDPIEATEPPKFIPEAGTIEKEASHFGILAFEDNWPMKGDYDLNDVVVKYNSTITYVQDGETTEESGGELVGKGEVTVKRVEDVFTFIHAGATFNNGFSYKVDIDPSSISEIKIIDDKNNSVAYNAIADGNGFIINLCPNVLDVIPSMQTVPTPAVYTVKMEFAEKAMLEQDFEDFKAPYNPFIIPENTKIITEKAIEVHLPLYHPTANMDLDLFGRYDDVSKNDYYYAAEEGTYFPYALHLAGAEEFAIPEENISIDNSYSKYMDWVNSRFAIEHSKWYLQP